MPFRHLPGAKLCRFKKGEILLASGEALTHVYYLVEGVVQREISTESGNETIVSLKTTDTPLDALVGLLLLYREGPLSNSTFRAMTDCACYQIPKASYLAVANKDPELLLGTIRLAMKETSRLTELYNGKREGDAASQFCRFLLDHAEQTEQGFVLPAYWSNLEIAKFLGVHTVTISRILGILRQKGCVSRISAGLYIADVKQLQALALGQDAISYRSSPKKAEK